MSCKICILLYGNYSLKRDYHDMIDGPIFQEGGISGIPVILKSRNNMIGWEPVILRQSVHFHNSTFYEIFFQCYCEIIMRWRQLLMNLDYIACVKNRAIRTIN